MKLSQSCPATLWLGQYRSTVRRRATSRKLKRGRGTSLGAQKQDQVITYRAAPKCFELEKAQTHRESSVPGWVFPVKLGGMCDPVPKTITIFMTKICHFPFPFYDLAKNFIHYVDLWPDPWINKYYVWISLFQSLYEEYRSEASGGSLIFKCFYCTFILLFPLEARYIRLFW